MRACLRRKPSTTGEWRLIGSEAFGMDQEAAANLLRCCLRIGDEGVTAARLEHLSLSDWDAVIQQSARHGVSPLLYWRMENLGAAIRIPASTLRELREAYLSSAARNMRLLHELSRVLRALQSDGTPVIALKGVHLAEVVYGNIALRPMGDVDLLVRKADLSGVVSRLLEIGYRPSRRFYVEVECAASQHVPPLYKSGAAPLEIHWSIARPTSPFAIDLDGLWQRARPTIISGIQALALSPEDLVLHLCLHTSFQHVLTAGLRAYCDVSETIQHYQGRVNWPQVCIRARRWGATKPAYLTLRMARELLSAAVPDQVLSALEPSDLELRFVEEAREWALCRQGAALPLSANLAGMWVAGGLREKVSAFLGTTFPPPEVLATLYPVSPSSKGVYVYWLVRLKDLILRYGRTVWRLLRHDSAMTATLDRQDRANALVDWLARP